MFLNNKKLLFLILVAACGKRPKPSPQGESSPRARVASPSATAYDQPDEPIADDLSTTTTANDLAPASHNQKQPDDSIPGDLSPNTPVIDLEQAYPNQEQSVDIILNQAAEASSQWPSRNQTHINVAVIGDSISQGSFAETTLGEPFPMRYAQFYDQHLHLLAWIKFAPSLDARTTLGHTMGQVFKDFWQPQSYVGNAQWGIVPQLKALYPQAEITVHSQALMASTAYSIESQLSDLLRKKIAYDYYLIGIGSNDVCSSDVITPELFGEKIQSALSKIRAFSTAPILLVQVSPIHKISALKDAHGQNILDKPIDYSQFYQHFGLSNFVAKIGLMPTNCREHIRIECPRALTSASDLEATVAKFNQQLFEAASSFAQVQVVSFDPNIEIEPQDLAADCFHPNSRLQKKFFSAINLEALLDL